MARPSKEQVNVEVVIILDHLAKVCEMVEHARKPVLSKLSEELEKIYARIELGRQVTFIYNPTYDWSSASTYLTEATRKYMLRACGCPASSDKEIFERYPEET